MGFTPFRLQYSEEAITLEELMLGSFWTKIEATTPIRRYVEIEMIETSWIHAVDNLDAYHAETKAWRDKKVVWKDINLGDLVLIHHPDKQGKLQPQWYGPFIVASMIKLGKYRWWTMKESK